MCEHARTHFTPKFRRVRTQIATLPNICCRNGLLRLAANRVSIRERHLQPVQSNDLLFRLKAMPTHGNNQSLRGKEAARHTRRGEDAQRHGYASRERVPTALLGDPSRPDKGTRQTDPRNPMLCLFLSPDMLECEYRCIRTLSTKSIPHNNKTMPLLCRVNGDLAKLLS